MRGGVGSAAALVGAKEVAGEAIARRAAPFLALTPAAIWWTSGDAFFAGVSATAVTLVILATGRERNLGAVRQRHRHTGQVTLPGDLMFEVFTAGEILPQGRCPFEGSNLAE